MVPLIIWKAVQVNFWVQGGQEGYWRRSRDQGGCLGDPMGPSGWFDESPDDS